MNNEVLQIAKYLKNKINAGEGVDEYNWQEIIDVCNEILRISASVKQIVFSCLGEHSEKPWEVKNRLEQLYGDVNRIELFARDMSQGWDAWGNQCPNNSIELIKSNFICKE